MVTQLEGWILEWVRYSKITQARAEAADGHPIVAIVVAQDEACDHHVAASADLRASAQVRQFRGGACVEVALLDDGRTAVRNSNYPDAGVVLFTRAEMDAYIKGVKASEFDDLT